MEIVWKVKDGKWKCYLHGEYMPSKDGKWTHSMPGYDELWSKGRLIATYTPCHDRQGGSTGIDQCLLIDGSWQYEGNLKDTDVRVVIEETDEYPPITTAERMSWMLQGKKI